MMMLSSFWSWLKWKFTGVKPAPIYRKWTAAYPEDRVVGPAYVLRPAAQVVARVAGRMLGHEDPSSADVVGPRPGQLSCSACSNRADGWYVKDAFLLAYDPLPSALPMDTRCLLHVAGYTPIDLKTFHQNKDAILQRLKTKYKRLELAQSLNHMLQSRPAHGFATQAQMQRLLSQRGVYVNQDEVVVIDDQADPNVIESILAGMGVNTTALYEEPGSKARVAVDVTDQFIPPGGPHHPYVPMAHSDWQSANFASPPPPPPLYEPSPPPPPPAPDYSSGSDASGSWSGD